MSSSSAAGISGGESEGLGAGGAFRWGICALLFFATTINYVDRQVLGLLEPTLQHKLGWTDLQYGYIVSAFQAAYAIGAVGMGWFIDRLGVRIGYAISIAIWSLSAMGHALARTATEFGIARFMLGIGEAGNFPAAIKAVAEWFPNKERALATGIFNSGTNVGATIGPLVVLAVAARLGWQFGFLLTGLFSAIWVVCWLAIYRPPRLKKRLSAAELAYIESDPPTANIKVSWLQLLPHRQTWAFVIGKFMTDPIWWFFLFWLPPFLTTKFHLPPLSVSKLGLPVVVIYNAATVGSVLGGWLPARFMKLGWPRHRARQAAMLICALAVVPILATAGVHSLWGAVGLISLATAAHQGWSANLFTLASDMFPKPAVASVVGFGQFFGAVGGALIALFVGFLLHTTHSYAPVFTLAASAYLLALLVIYLLAPTLRPAQLAVKGSDRAHPEAAGI